MAGTHTFTLTDLPDDLRIKSYKFLPMDTTTATSADDRDSPRGDDRDVRFSAGSIGLLHRITVRATQREGVALTPVVVCISGLATRRRSGILGLWLDWKTAWANPSGALQGDSELSGERRITVDNCLVGVGDTIRREVVTQSAATDYDEIQEFLDEAARDFARGSSSTKEEEQAEVGGPIRPGENYNKDDDDGGSDGTDLGEDYMKPYPPLYDEPPVDIDPVIRREQTSTSAAGGANSYLDWIPRRFAPRPWVGSTSRQTRLTPAGMFALGGGTAALVGGLGYSLSRIRSGSRPRSRSTNKHSEQDTRNT
jgi:hypothetical protein